MPDVFISYARGDRKRVRPIAKALAAEGFDVWWDQSSSPDGAWTPQLRRALVDSAAILACWSQEATKSSWVAAEATHANDRKALVGAILEACKVPPPFNAVESADLIKWRGDQDAQAWRNIVRQLRQLVRARDGDIGEHEEEEEEAPPQMQRAPAPPAQQAAQVVAPTAFFSQSLGRPQQAQARAAQPQSPQRAFQPIDAPPPPPKPPPRVVLPPMDPPPPTPRPRTVEQRRPARPVEEPPPPRAFAPEKRSPVRPVDEPADKRRPVRPAEETVPRAAAPQQPRPFQPIDEPPQRPSRQSERDRRAAPPPPRAYVPVDEAPPRRKAGFAQFVLLGAVAAVIVAGVIWGGQRFLTAPSAPKLAQDREAAAPPEPLPTEATSEAQTDEIPSAEELLRAEVEQAPLEPPPGLAKAPPPPSAAATAQTAPATRAPAQQQKLSTTPTQQATTRPSAQSPQLALALRPTTQPTDPVTRPPTRTANTQTTTQPARTPSTTPATQPPPTRTASTQTTTQPARTPSTTPATQAPPTRTAGTQTTTQPARTASTTPATQPPPTRTAGTQTTTQPARTAGTTPATQPPLNTSLRQTAPARLSDAGTAPVSADATRELERCLGHLVRMCPSGGGGRPGFAEDGALSASERALLNQRSLFAWSDAISSNVANCSRHLNAAGQAGQTPYQPLATACRGLPTSGPPR